MAGSGMSMSPARVFFGFAVLVAACAFLANAISFEVFDTNALVFVLVGALACCVIACSTEIWRSGYECFTGKENVNPVYAAGFWNSFGTYAWYCGWIGAFMAVVAYGGAIRGASSFDSMFVPAVYFLCYGAFFRVVGYSVACACCGGCLPGGIGIDASVGKTNAKVGNAKKKAKENVSA